MAGLMGASSGGASAPSAGIPPDLLQTLVGLPGNVLKGLVSLPQGIVGGTAPQTQDPSGAPPLADPNGNANSGVPAPTTATTAPAAGPVGGGAPQSGPGGFLSGLLSLPGDYVNALGAQLKATPQDIALELAQRRFQIAQMERLMQALPSLPAREQLAAILNGGELGKSLAANYAPINMAGGSTELMAGGPDQGGSQVTAPLVGFDAVSGRGTSVDGQGNLSSGGVALPGKYSAADGIIMNDRSGVAGSYALPQKLAPGEHVESVQPGFAQLPPAGGASSIGPGASPIVPQVGQPPAPPFTPSSTTSTTAGKPGFAAIRQAFRGQESGNNPNVGYSAKGAGGIGQVMPGTFAMYAKPGEQFGNPTDMGNVSDRILGDYYQRFGGDPAKMAVAYFSNPNNVAQNGQTPWVKDLSDGHTLTSQYVSGIMGRLGGGGGPTGVAAPAQPTTPTITRNADGSVTSTGSSSSGANGLGGKPLYTIKPGSQVPGGDPNQNYQVNTATGEATVSPKAFNMETVQANRHAFYSSEAYKDAMNNIAPIKGMFDTVSTVAPSGVVSMAALDTLNKSLNPGGVVRPQTLNIFLEHIGLPQELQGNLLSTLGNGFLTPQVLQQIGRASWLYARSHAQQAANIAANDVASAQRYGFKAEDVNETPPAVPDPPKWVQDQLPAVKDRVVGKTYWSPKGPAIWNGKGWQLQ